MDEDDDEDDENAVEKSLFLLDDDVDPNDCVGDANTAGLASSTSSWSVLTTKLIMADDNDDGVFVIVIDDFDGVVVVVFVLVVLPLDLDEDEGLASSKSTAVSRERRLLLVVVMDSLISPATSVNSSFSFICFSFILFHSTNVLWVMFSCGSHELCLLHIRVFVIVIDPQILFIGPGPT